MNIVQAGFEIWENDELRGGMANIERAGRVCYKSEDRICDGSAEKFVSMLIKNGHEAMLEHGEMIFEVDGRHILENVSDDLLSIKNSGNVVPRLEMTRSIMSGRSIISGNIRAWRQLFKSNAFSALYFMKWFDPVYLQDCDDGDAMLDYRVQPISRYSLTTREEKMVHKRYTVRFTTDRGIANEFTRHRAFSFAQESTRYCNYKKNGITVIEPSFHERETLAYKIWNAGCLDAEKAYMALLNDGATPQEARATLPLCTKTELVQTGNLLAWQLFFDLRAKDLHGKVHPQAKELAYPLYKQFATLERDVIR